MSLLMADRTGSPANERPTSELAEWGYEGGSTSSSASAWYFLSQGWETFSEEDEGVIPEAVEEEGSPEERWLEGRSGEVLAAPFVFSLPVLKSESRGAKQLEGTPSSD